VGTPCYSVVKKRRKGTGTQATFAEATVAERLRVGGREGGTRGRGDACPDDKVGRGVSGRVGANGWADSDSDLPGAFFQEGFDCLAVGFVEQVRV